MAMAEPPGNPFSREALMDAINVTQGVWVVERSRLLHTILGSCVSVCLHDAVAGVGGMNHYVYPPRGVGMIERFGNTPFSADLCLDGLLEAMLRAGARRERLRAKAFGGGQMFDLGDAIAIGKRNTSYARFWLTNSGIPLDLSDFHGSHTRKLVFHPASGQHLCQHLPTRFEPTPVK
jgi:chemotaxis protein CheD